MRWILPLLLLAAPVRALEVDVELVLAVDTSLSMDVDELRLQREDYAAALESPEFHAVLARSFTGRIALTYFDWGGVNWADGARVEVILPWTLIEGADDAIAAAAILRAAPARSLRGTSISGAIEAARRMFDDNGFEGMRRVIDVSGDGPNNMGGPVTAARDRAVADGITVNGLPIQIKEPGGWFNIDNLDAYYADCVIGGPGAFVIPVDDRRQLRDAIVRKLVIEVAGLEPQPRVIRVAGADCLIGEKLRQRYMGGQ